MKKLMIALGAVALAAGVQAATIQWSTTNTKAGYTVTSGTTSTGVAANLTAYIFDVATSSAEDTYKAFAKNGSAGLTGKYFGEGKTAASKIDTTETSYGTEGKQYTFYAAILVQDTANNKEYLYLTQEKTDITGGDPKVASPWLFGNQNSATGGTYSSAPALSSWGGTGHWYSYSAVPEPTSGLLLLLGVAGLALRRRRA